MCSNRSTPMNVSFILPSFSNLSAFRAGTLYAIMNGSVNAPRTSQQYLATLAMASLALEEAAVAKSSSSRVRVNGPAWVDEDAERRQS